MSCEWEDPGFSNHLHFADEQLSRLSAGLIICDLNLNCLFWGKIPEKMTKIPKGQAEAKNILGICHEFLGEGLEATLRKAFEGQSSEICDRTCSDGELKTQIYFDLSVSPFRSVEGKIIGGIILLADVSRTKIALDRLAETETRFKNMADHSPVLLWMSGTDGLCNFFNQTWLDFTGRTMEQEWGVGWAEAIHHEDFQRCVDTYVSHFNARTPFEMEYRLRRHDGAYRWILDRGTPRFSPDKSFAGFIGSCIDVTDYKNAVADLVQSKREAESANQAKTNFLATVSHEIRTPLGIVLGFANLLTSGLDNNGDRTKWVRIIKHNGDLLASIIDSILDLSKIELDRLEIENKDVSLQEILDDVAAMTEFAALEKGLSFTLKTEGELPDRICTDPLRMKQTLLNVIGNAIKYTPSGRVDVVVGSKKTPSPSEVRLWFEIMDTGIGLAPEASKKIFKPFTQADTSNTRKFGGVGIGLTLAKRLAQILGGDVSLVKSEPDKGSVFRIEVQVGVSSQSATEGTPCPVVSDDVSSLRGMRVLVVDDFLDNLILLGTYLRRSGAVVETAENGSIGVRKALSESFDVILMDIQMPVKNGIEAMEDLVQANYQKPVIALTAHALKQEKDRILSLGFKEHISKPVDRIHLVHTLRKYHQPAGLT